ncbi:hypothetical protein HAX54_004716 [Datura stramonium]|uniref:Uncharacterized protein n=1 Tax=Datura stramonium TaxID=4076 RepID=A0ABS8T7D4_DATST|nr:hypothetical protein [Datura stramonium]
MTRRTAIHWFALTVTIVLSPWFSLPSPYTVTKIIVTISLDKTLIQNQRSSLEIANAYEILKDEATREHFSTIQHLKLNMLLWSQTDTRAVLVGLLLIISSFQYLNQWTRYNQAIDISRKHQLINKLTCFGASTHWRRANRKKRATSRWMPSVWELIGTVILLPYTLGKLLLWYGCWFWRYNVKRAPYSCGRCSYLTRRSLRASLDSWISMDESTKENLIERRLWEKSNFESYVAEMR